MTFFVTLAASYQHSLGFT